MKAKEFEAVCAYRMSQEDLRDRVTMSRYGVQGTLRANERGEMTWQPVQSLPDFEGILPPLARQFIFDCKVCSQASFALDEDKFKRRQLRHMLIRASYGAICFLALHFNERVLTKQTIPEQTWAFPIFASHPMWEAFDRGEKKRITLEDCGEYAVPILWNMLPGNRKPRPDLLTAIHALAERLDSAERLGLPHPEPYRGEPMRLPETTRASTPSPDGFSLSNEF